MPQFGSAWLGLAKFQLGLITRLNTTLTPNPNYMSTLQTSKDDMQWELLEVCGLQRLLSFIEVGWSLELKAGEYYLIFNQVFNNLLIFLFNAIQFSQKKIHSMMKKMTWTFLSMRICNLETVVFIQGLLEFIWTKVCSGQSSNPGPALAILVLWYK